MGDPIPDVVVRTLSGDSLRLDALGAPALVNLWATWCAPCRYEMPFLEELHRRFGPRGLRVVGVSTDDAGARRAVEAFVAEVGVSFEILLDPRGLTFDRFRVLGLPASYLVDADGTIRLVRTGPVSERDTAFLAALDTLLMSVDGGRP